jgi:hypothetical protein
MNNVNPMTGCYGALCHGRSLDPKSKSRPSPHLLMLHFAEFPVFQSRSYRVSPSAIGHGYEIDDRPRRFLKTLTTTID